MSPRNRSSPFWISSVIALKLCDVPLDVHVGDRVHPVANLARVVALHADVDEPRVDLGPDGDEALERRHRVRRLRELRMRFEVQLLERPLRDVAARDHLELRREVALFGEPAAPLGPDALVLPRQDAARLGLDLDDDGRFVDRLGQRRRESRQHPDQENDRENRRSAVLQDPQRVEDRGLLICIVRCKRVGHLRRSFALTFTVIRTGGPTEYTVVTEIPQHGLTAEKV